MDRSFFASPVLMQLTENMVAISFNTSLQKYGGDMAVASVSILNSVMQSAPRRLCSISIIGN